MVKLMQHSLSRIEREYVVQHLGEMLPSLVLLHGNDFETIPTQSYTCDDETIILHGISPLRSEKKDMRVFFRHEQRGMYFESSAQTDPKGIRLIPVSPKLFLHEETQKSKSDSTIRIEYTGGTYSTSSEARYPLDTCFIDPEMYGSHHTGMKKVADKIGLTVSMTNYSVASYRLFEYLDGFRILCDDKKITGSLFYIDNNVVLLSVPENSFPSKKIDEMLSVSFTSGKRNIRFTAGMQGILPVNKLLNVLHLQIIEAQEEDKRFLYERLFKDKYLG